MNKAKLQEYRLKFRIIGGLLKKNREKRKQIWGKKIELATSSIINFGELLYLQQRDIKLEKHYQILDNRHATLHSGERDIEIWDCMEEAEE